MRYLIWEEIDPLLRETTAPALLASQFKRVQRDPNQIRCGMFDVLLCLSGRMRMVLTLFNFFTVVHQDIHRTSCPSSINLYR